MYARFATRTLRLIAGHDRKDNADILWQTFAFGNVRQQGLQGRRIRCGVPGIQTNPPPSQEDFESRGLHPRTPTKILLA